MKDVSLQEYIGEAVGVATDLCYEWKYIERLKKAKSEYEVDNILIDARRNSR